MSSSSYMEQYKRMIRFFKRFRKIHEGKTHNQTSDHNKDDVYSFFIHCYHLKDWIKNDPASGINSRTVEHFVHADLNLKICGDISNGIKHLLLDNPKVDTGAEIQGSHLSVHLGQRKQIIRTKYTIVAGTDQYDAFSVAKDSVNSWKQFLTTRIANFNP